MSDDKWQELLQHPIYKSKAISDYKSTHPRDLSFENGDIIEVLVLGKLRSFLHIIGISFL